MITLYAFFTTFLIGAFCGAVFIVYISTRMDAKEIQRRMDIHPSTRVGENPFIPRQR